MCASPKKIHLQWKFAHFYIIEIATIFSGRCSDALDLSEKSFFCVRVSFTEVHCCCERNYIIFIMLRSYNIYFVSPAKRTDFVSMGKFMQLYRRRSNAAIFHGKSHLIRILRYFEHQQFFWKIFILSRETYGVIDPQKIWHSFIFADISLNAHTALEGEIFLSNSFKYPSKTHIRLYVPHVFECRDQFVVSRPCATWYEILKFIVGHFLYWFRFICGVWHFEYSLCRSKPCNICSVLLFVFSFSVGIFNEVLVNLIIIRHAVMVNGIQIIFRLDMICIFLLN